MLQHFKALLGLSTLLAGATVNAHVAAFHKGMYCLNGVGGGENLNSYDIVTPLYQLPFRQWWFHHVNRCDEYPPAPGDFLDLPAGGSFKIDIGSNRAKTTMSYNGRDTSAWPDGSNYDDNRNEPNCIIHPNLHTQNRTMAAGTVFAISYTSDLKAVTPENLVVFTVRHNTPWKREVWYDVPAAMPACPPGGCICAWGWVPNGCGQPNMYHQGFRCRVTGATSVTPVATGKPPVWCQGNPGACTKGAKQMVYWNQLEGNNVWVNGLNDRGFPKSPGYNAVMGFMDGAQNDIFSGAPASSGGSAPPSSGGGSNNSNNNSGNSNAGGSGTPANGGNHDSGNKAASTTSATSASAISSSPSSKANAVDAGLTDYTPQCRRRRRRRSGGMEKRALRSHQAKAQANRPL